MIWCFQHKKPNRDKSPKGENTMTAKKGDCGGKPRVGKVGDKKPARPRGGRRPRGRK